MKQLLWTTDIHLNFLDPYWNKITLKEYLDKVGSGNTLVITGDIAEAPSLVGFMAAWQKALEANGSKLYFVCGNHDYYHGSIIETRDRIIHCPLKESWLPSAGIIKLSDKVSLVGHDGWYDGGYADWYASRVEMTDYDIIKELGYSGAPGKDDKYEAIQKLSQEGADYVYMVGSEALKSCEKLYIATHVPPFAEASVHRGKMSDNDWLPHFSSKRMGDAIHRLAEENPEKRLIVLCGHTHGKGLCYPAANISCHTGYAVYGNPMMNSRFEIEE